MGGLDVFAGLSAFKTMFDMAKALKDMNDSAPVPAVGRFYFRVFVSPRLVG